MVVCQLIFRFRTGQGLPTAIDDNELPSFTLDRNSPVTAQVYAHLRRLVLGLHLKPGEALSEKDISLKLGLSRTPVREAFIRLSDEGLVDIFPQRGTLVAPIRIAEVKEAHFIRCILELAVVRLVAEARNPRQLAQLEENLRQQATAQRLKDYDAFMELDETFHRLLSEGVSLPRVWRVIQSVKGQLDRVRYSILPERGHSTLIRRQHMAILKAIQSGDADRAETEMREHLDQIWASIEQLMKDNRDYFQD